jgi:hypothetical protein
VNKQFYLKKPILTIFAAGTFAKNIEKMTNQQIIDSAMQYIKTIWP